MPLAEVGKLANLRMLDLRDFWLSGAIPPGLGNLTNLVYLDLTGNRLSGCIPASLNRAGLEIVGEYRFCR